MSLQKNLIRAKHWYTPKRPKDFSFGKHWGLVGFLRFLLFPSSSQKVPERFLKFSMCSQDVPHSTTQLSISLNQSFPFFICRWGKVQELYISILRLLFLGSLQSFSIFFETGQSKMDHCNKKKRKEAELGRHPYLI